MLSACLTHFVSYTCKKYVWSDTKTLCFCMILLRSECDYCSFKFSFWPASKLVNVLNPEQCPLWLFLIIPSDYYDSCADIKPGFYCFPTVRTDITITQNPKWLLQNSSNVITFETLETWNVIFNENWLNDCWNLSFVKKLAAKNKCSGVHNLYKAWD